jgi:hypothetical protein
LTDETAGRTFLFVMNSRTVDLALAGSRFRWWWRGVLQEVGRA